MDSPRWWHVAIAAVTVVLGVVTLTSEIPDWKKVGALTALGVFALAWYAFGRLSWQNQVAKYAFAAVVIVATGVAVAFFPLMAILQCVSYPLVWVTMHGLRRALVANVLLATAVGIGYLVSTGNLLETTFTIGLSLAFSLALGTWITRIAQLSTERQQLLDELRETQSRLGALSRDAGAASERERLAREIHDTIAQDLTALVMLTERSRRELAAGNLAIAGEQLALAEESARSALTETRSLVAASAPVGLGGGIHEALDRLAERFSRETGVTVGVEAGDLPTIDRDTEVVLLRVAQEGLANVRKHAEAESAVVTLNALDGAITLSVRDDGAGFDPTVPTDGFGLEGMRDRLALVGGSLDVASSPTGTALTATLPAPVAS